MLLQFVAIAFTAGSADVTVLDRQLAAEGCTAYLEQGAPDGWVQAGAPMWVGNDVLACIPDNVDF